MKKILLPEKGLKKGATEWDLRGEHLYCPATEWDLRGEHLYCPAAEGGLGGDRKAPRIGIYHQKRHLPVAF